LKAKTDSLSDVRKAPVTKFVVLDRLHTNVMSAVADDQLAR
jgi:hypothetical protein